MNYCSTRDTSAKTDVSTAILQGLAPDGGLFYPSALKKLDKTWLSTLPGSDASLVEIGQHCLEQFVIGKSLTKADLKKALQAAYDFDTPLTKLDDNTYVLELFHGPTAAFKDVGAQMMAQLVSRLAGDDKEYTILTATSGDTGSAVASAFHKVPGVRVFILYPSGKVSKLQELQLTTFGDNIIALEVDGTFDDCQKLVKQAFEDKKLVQKYGLTTANSINIARLLPQMLYYFRAVAQLPKDSEPPVMVVPSGNFGNLTSGLIAQRIGLNFGALIAATNANDVVPDYLQTGTFKARPSVLTHSNAMDVGNPSNLERIQHMYESDPKKITKDIWTSLPGITDQQTVDAIKYVKETFDYEMDPHGAVGYATLTRYRYKTKDNRPAIVFETAHPAKFGSVMKHALGYNPKLPKQLEKYTKLKKSSIKIKPELDSVIQNL